MTYLPPGLRLGGFFNIDYGAIACRARTTMFFGVV
jgi:hypothetical protein